ncbi:MAG: GNAT family N-acetyltransferase [Christensenellaceae bacterium]|nr:GNAT family N-acetyltransferase [Christensenellaceae bacterium]
MDIILERISANRKHVLANLFEKYQYDFSKFSLVDVDEDGLYGFPDLDRYFNSDTNFAFLLRVKDKIAGFVLIDNHSFDSDRNIDFSITEMTLLYKYRQRGFGRKVLIQLFNMLKGNWQIRYYPGNKASAYFWQNVVREYTENNYELLEFYPPARFKNGSAANIIFFNN